MDVFYKILNIWYIKLGLGTVLALFSPVYVSILTLFIIILLDTITGVSCAVKMKRFNSRAFRKSFKKLLVYLTCVFTIRLVEISVLYTFNTVAITQFVLGFLIITEGVSIIENLTMLGLPIPADFLYILFKQVRIGIIDEMLYKNKNSEMREIEEVLHFQISSIKSENLRKLLQIYFEQYINIGNRIVEYLNNVKNIDNDLIYYRVLNIISFGFEETKNFLNDENIPKDLTSQFNARVQPSINECLTQIKEICYRLIVPEKKKEEIINKLTVLAYRIMFEVQKNGIGE